jgi:hypothetical protein
VSGVIAATEVYVFLTTMVVASPGSTVDRWFPPMSLHVFVGTELGCRVSSVHGCGPIVRIFGWLGCVCGCDVCVGLAVFL